MRRRTALLACLALTVAFCPQLRGQEAGRRLTIRTDRPDAVYAKGGPTTFLVELSGGSEPMTATEADCELSTGGFRTAEKSRIAIADGRAQVTALRDYACVLWIRVTCTPAGQQPVQALAGAAFAPEEIKPSMPEPEDFDEFWAVQRARLDAIPPNASLEPVAWTDPNVELFSITMDNVGGTRIYGYLAKPKGNGPFPAYFQPQWAGVYSLDPAWAAGRAQQGFVALNINAHAIENGKPADYYRSLDQGALRGYPYQGRESRDTCYFLRMYLSCYRAAEYLASRPDWDGKHLVVAGDSQGGGQAIVTAALSPHVTAVAAGVPALCDLTAAAADRAPGWPMLVELRDGRPDPVQLETARYFDVVNFARRVRVQALVGTGFGDLVCPASGVYAAYNALAGPKRMVLDPLCDHAQGKANWWRESWEFVNARGRD
jgi:cephalosporin-C deacetylase-like acetyl esterase